MEREFHIRVDKQIQRRNGVKPDEEHQRAIEKLWSQYFTPTTISQIVQSRKSPKAIKKLQGYIKSLLEKGVNIDIVRDMYIYLFQMISKEDSYLFSIASKAKQNPSWKDKAYNILNGTGKALGFLGKVAGIVTKNGLAIGSAIALTLKYASMLVDNQYNVQDMLHRTSKMGLFDSAVSASLNQLVHKGGQLLTSYVKIPGAGYVVGKGLQIWDQARKDTAQNREKRGKQQILSNHIDRIGKQFGTDDQVKPWRNAIMSGYKINRDMSALYQQKGLSWESYADARDYFNNGQYKFEDHRI